MEELLVASVVTFWQLPDEEAAFFRYLAREAEVVAVRHTEAVPDPATIQSVPVKEFIGRSDTSRLHFTLKSVASEPLVLRRWESESAGNPARYSLPVDFPAIVYDVGSLEGGALSQSNASAYPLEAPTVVSAWMRRVFGWLRQNTPHWHEYEGYRVTERAARAAVNGLRLVPYHGWRGRSTGRSSFTPDTFA
jgi:hypothetical protein